MKNWTKAALGRGYGLRLRQNFFCFALLSKLKETGNTDRKRGSGRPKLACTEENVLAVKEFVLSQQDKPQSHHCTRQIVRNNGLA